MSKDEVRQQTGFSEERDRQSSEDGQASLEALRAELVEHRRTEQRCATPTGGKTCSSLRWPTSSVIPSPH